jgi:hypothetical protein
MGTTSIGAQGTNLVDLERYGTVSMSDEVIAHRILTYAHEA